MPSKTLKSERVPAQLPAELLPALLRVKRVLLCLDYDGTISEIVRNPAVARPVPGVLEALAELAMRPDRIALAIVSGGTTSGYVEFVLFERGGMLFWLEWLAITDLYRTA